MGGDGYKIFYTVILYHTINCAVLKYSHLLTQSIQTVAEDVAIMGSGATTAYCEQCLVAMVSNIRSLAFLLTCLARGKKCLSGSEWIKVHDTVLRTKIPFARPNQPPPHLQSHFPQNLRAMAGLEGMASRFRLPFWATD